MSNGIGMKIAGIAGVLVVLAGGFGAAYAFSDTVKNQVKLATSSPEDYFAWVYEKNTRDLAALFENGYQSYSDRMNGSSGAVALQFAPSEEAKAFLIDEMLGGDPADADSQKAVDLINGIHSLELAIESSGSEHAATGTVKLRRNDTDVTAMEVAADVQAGTAYLRIPDLTSRWIGVDLADYAQDQEIYGFSSAPSAALEPAAISECVTKYGELLVKDAKNITVEKKKAVQIGSFSTEYTAMTATVSETELLDKLILLTDTASTDAVLKQLFPEEANFSGAMLDAGDELRELRDSGLIGSGKMDIITYVDAAGTIRGYYTEIGKQFTFYTAVGMQDQQMGAVMQVSAMGTSLMDIRANATHGNNGFTGSLSASFDNAAGSPQKMTVSFTDLSVVDAEKGYVSGSMNIQLPEMDEIQLTLSSDGSAQDLSYPVVVESMQVGELTLRVTVEESGAATMPDTADVYQLHPQQEFRLSEYVTETELSAYITGVLERFGVSPEDAAQLGESMGALAAYY